ncbi:MAG: sel1 repeat family protein [Oscillospiraceae bacterium]|nr:sel1 repeat family protein [Oscillospiraceae bacterium]
MQIRNSNPDGNKVFFLEPEEKGESHVIMHTLHWNEPSEIAGLLAMNSDKDMDLGVELVINETDDRSFMVIHNPHIDVPYPKVFVAKYITDDFGNRVIIDVEDDDLDVIPFIRDRYLTLDETIVIPLVLNPEWDGDDSDILNDLGCAYENGTIFEQDYTAAYNLFKIAADKGDETSLYNLGRMYEHGRGIEKDIPKAIEAYKAASDMGDIDAMLNLGLIYLSGEDITPNYDEVFKLFKRAAEKGCEGGKYHLALCYYFGKGTRLNYKKAFPLFKELADDGDVNSCYFMGCHYRFGRGVKQNLDLSRKYFRRGYIYGDVDSTAEMGYIYEYGLGVPVDLNAAYDYYSEAAQKGQPYSVEAVKRLKGEEADD